MSIKIIYNESMSIDSRVSSLDAAARAPGRTRPLNPATRARRSAASRMCARILLLTTLSVCAAAGAAAAP